MQDYDEDNFRGAKYDLRMADTGMVLPGGRVIRPSDTAYRSPVILNPGEAIFVSTRERFHMPADVVGNMSIKGDLSRDGILALTGLIVDPGYAKGPSGDGRLHFRLANLGPRPVVLRPGDTAIASIQFLQLSAPADVGEPRFADAWADVEQLKEGLGFIEQLRTVSHSLERLRRDFEQQRRTVDYVVVAGLLVVVTTLLGVAVAGLLSLGADSRLIKSARNIVPDDRGGQVLFVLALFALALVGAGLVMGARLGGRPIGLTSDVVAVTRNEGYRKLLIARMRNLAFASAAVVTVGWVAVAVAVSLGASTALDIGIGVVVALLGVGVMLAKLWKPITPKRVDDELGRWYSDEAA
ncbi:MAG TPA: hypothetical protein VI318_26710 [Baekduia sp.]